MLSNGSSSSNYTGDTTGANVAEIRVGGDDEEEEIVEQWPKCHPDQVLSRLKKLPIEHKGANPRLFYSTYAHSWKDLTDTQKNRTMEYWNNLTEPIKVGILASASQSSDVDEGGKLKRRDTTTKDDMVRLLELRRLPQAQIWWTASRDTMDRATLDARNSSATPNAHGDGFMSDYADPYGKLAELFNDYRSFTPQNALIQYEPPTDPHGVPVPKVPFKPITPDVTILATHCYDVNPTNMARSNSIRDGAWIKDKWTQLKRLLTIVFGDFERSGKQRGPSEAEVEWLSEEECSRWVYHATRAKEFPVVLTYAYFVMRRIDFENLGKQIEPGIGRDNSLSGSSHADATTVERKRRKRQEEAKQKKKRKRSDSSSLEDIIANAVQAENNISILKFLAKTGTAHGKGEAMKKLNSLLPRELRIPTNETSTSRAAAESSDEESEEQSSVCDDSDDGEEEE